MIGIRFYTVLQKVYPCPGEHFLFFYRYDTPAQKKLCILSVLKKYLLCSLKRQVIQERHKSSEHRDFKSASKPLDVCCVRNLQPSADKPSINVGFDRIGKDVIRTFIHQKLIITFHQFSIGYCTDFAPFQRDRNTFCTHFFKVLFMCSKRHSQNHIICFQNCGNEFFSEFPHHTRMIGKHQNFLLHGCTLSACLPSWIPSCLTNTPIVFQAQKRSIPKLI